ncbi:MAG: hypothetical protein RIB60_01500 [Phycisphaerales bacterium]
MAFAEFVRSIPILPVRDAVAMRDWYRDRLGFGVITSQDDPNLPPPGLGYVVLRRGNAEVHLQWQFERDMAGVEPRMIQMRFQLETGGVDALFAEYSAAGVVPAGKSVRETIWGTREFAFHDREGYGLTFFEDR